jgi:hypothetical protein
MFRILSSFLHYFSLEFIVTIQLCALLIKNETCPRFSPEDVSQTILDVKKFSNASPGDSDSINISLRIDVSWQAYAWKHTSGVNLTPDQFELNLLPKDMPKKKHSGC